MEHWAKTAELEGLRYFAQRLDEMLFDYTLDTYKPAALNSISLCDEALSLISDVENKIIDEQNLEHVMDELLWALRQDDVAKKLLDLDPEFYVQTDRETPLPVKRRRLETLSGSLGVFRYVEAGKEKLARAVRGNSKSEIDALLRGYVPALINHGVSKQSIHDRLIECFFRKDKQVTDVSDVDKFLEKIYPYTHEFNIIFSVSNLILQVKDSVRAFKLKIAEELPEEFQQFATSHSIRCEEGYVFVEVTDVSALDNYSALEKAEQKLEQLSNLFAFFSHKTRLNWSDRVMMTRCCEPGVVSIRRPLSPIQKCSDHKPQFAAQKLNNMLGSLSLRGSSFVKFNQAIELHGMALESAAPDNQLLNLWIAIETITPSSASDSSKIAKIVSGFMPFLLSRYIERIVIMLTKDLLRWNRKACHEIIGKVDGNKKFHQKVLRLVTLSEYDEFRREFYSRLDDFPLLRYRIFSLHERMKGPDKIKAMLNLHKKKLEWQIRRIYRTRNLMVHSGRTPSFVDTLIENSHDYLDQVLSRIMRFGEGDFPVSSLNQAFDIVDAKYIGLESALNRIKEFDGSTVEIILSN
jgi:hypothetical protein